MYQQEDQFQKKKSASLCVEQNILTLAECRGNTHTHVEYKNSDETVAPCSQIRFPQKYKDRIIDYIPQSGLLSSACD